MFDRNNKHQLAHQMKANVPDLANMANLHLLSHNNAIVLLMVCNIFSNKLKNKYIKTISRSRMQKDVESVLLSSYVHVRKLCM